MDTQILRISKPPLIFARGVGDISAVRNELMNMNGLNKFVFKVQIMLNLVTYYLHSSF